MLPNQSNANNLNNQMSNPMFNNMNQINNMGGLNAMVGSQNSLYNQNFQQTWNNMQQNQVQLIETNFNNLNNILSLINLPVLLPYHSHHPLINCKTPGRAKPGSYWKCNSCGSDYSYNVPTFYCTNCDFDLCQKCFLSLYAYQIVVYNYNMGIIQENNNTNPNFYNPKIHNHPMVLILREASYYTSNLKCNLCIKEINKQEPFNYCSLCNYCICNNCYIVKSQQ